MKLIEWEVNAKDAGRLRSNKNTTFVRNNIRQD